MKPSDYVSFVKELYKLCFEENKEKEICFLNSNIRTLSMIYNSNDIGTIRNYLIREIFASKNSYRVKTLWAREICNYDLIRLKAVITSMANVLYNRILYLQNIQPNTSILEIAELVLKLNDK